MSGDLLEGISPVTHTIESGKALEKFLGLSEELPEAIALANGARLTLSSKRDCHYYTSPKGFSRKAGTYGRMCKHRKALERPSLWAAGGNGPVMPEEMV
ncbi:Uncharacterised protein [uncultured archaeon]|nr:Uncharacterised protein [uncultured archaeon]